VVVRGCNHFGRDARQVAIELVILSTEEEGTRPGFVVMMFKPKLTRQIIAEAVCAIWDGSPPSGATTSVGRRNSPPRFANDEFDVAGTSWTLQFEKNLHAGGAQFRFSMLVISSAVRSQKS